jgi:hypothetical protein
MRMARARHCWREEEDVMIEFSAATRALTLALIAATGLAVTSAEAATTKRRAAVVYSNGPDYSYQSGPRTRIYVSKRSWLDGGTEVLPGERKFTDYAIPPTYSPVAPIQNTTFYRQPLPSPWDLPGRDAPWRLNPCVGC